MKIFEVAGVGKLHGLTVMSLDSFVTNDDVEEAAEGRQKHKVAVTVSEPDHSAVSKRKELKQRMCSVTADGREQACDTAINWYKKQGYKVHDHNYVGLAEGYFSDQDVQKKDRQYAGTKAYHARKKAEKEKASADAKSAFGDMFGGGNPADKLKIKDKDVAEGNLKEFAPGGQEGNGPFDYGSAIVQIGEDYTELYNDDGDGADAARIIKVGKTFMDAGMTAGINAFYAMDTMVRDHVAEQLQDLNFNVRQDIYLPYRQGIAKKTADGDAKYAAHQATPAGQEENRNKAVIKAVIVSGSKNYQPGHEVASLIFDKRKQDVAQRLAEIKKEMSERFGPDVKIDYQVTIGGNPVQVKEQGVAEGGEKYKVKSIGHDAKGDYYISPSTGKKVYKSGVKVGDHENPKTGEHKGVAESRENFNGIDISIEIQKDDEYVDDEDYDNQVLYVTASSKGKELGHVLFAFDGEYLMPQDLEVEERYRGQGIAQIMYDYVKSKGYKIRRSGQQTDAGAGFWDKHKPGKNVWEQGVAEAPGDFGLGANYRAVPDDEMQQFLDRSKTKTKTKRDKFDYPYVHGSNIQVKDEGGKAYDADALKKSIMIRPASILGQNAKMQHSETGEEAIFDIGLPALKGLAVNEKTGEFVVVDTCPGAGACKTFCYAMKGSYVMFKAVSMGLARMLNFLLNDPEGFASQLNSEIAAAKAKMAKKNAKVVVRWHDAGDFFSAEYLNMAYSVANANPDVGFYAYTKMADVATGARPKNFNMNFSGGALSSQEKKIDFKRVKHSKVVPKDMFFDLIARDGTSLKKDAKGRMQFASPENMEEFKGRMAKQYAIDRDSILTYDEMMKTPVGDTPKWNVIVMPGDGDNSANRNDVVGSYLLFH